MNLVDIKCIAKENAVLPEYKTSGASGADVCAYLPEGSVILKAGKSLIVPTGLSFEIPQGYEIQVRPRSGLAAKNQITVLNTPGTIDSDYRGELMVILINLGEKDFEINNKDRIAQIIVSPVTLGNFIVSESLSSTDRGNKGFGSTGIK